MHRFFCFSGILTLLITFVSCDHKDEAQQPYQTTSLGGIAMEMPYKVTVGKGLSQEEKGRVEAAIKESFSEINAIYNNWNPDSEVSRFNSMPTYLPAQLSPQLENLLEITNSVVAITGGRFDPTIEPVRLFWKDRFKEGIHPDIDSVRKIKKSTGWWKVRTVGGRIYKTESNLSLDLGGIAKGHGVDTLVEKIANLGFTDLYVEWGGEIRASGRHPEGRPWRVYIARLEDTDPANAIDYVELSNEAIATSGDYLQNWTLTKNDGTVTVYSHVIDPRTAVPIIVAAGRIASVSVVAPTCSLADGLATAAMLFDDIEEAKKWAEEIRNQNPSIKFWFVSREAADSTY